MNADAYANLTISCPVFAQKAKFGPKKQKNATLSKAVAPVASGTTQPGNAKGNSYVRVERGIMWMGSVLGVGV